MDVGISLSSIPENLEIVERDDIIIHIMDYEGINRERNTSSNFISGAYALDNFIKEKNYLFSSQKALGGYSQYDAGYALAKTETSIITKVRQALINEFYFSYHDQIRANFSEYDATYYSTLRDLSGKDQPPIPINIPYYDYKGILRFKTVWSSKIAQQVAEQAAEIVLGSLKNNYLVLSEYFQLLFCDEPK